MPYGGPRFEFFTQNQFDNHTAFICKEDAARVAAIHQHQTDAAEAECQQTRQHKQQVLEEAQRVESAVQSEVDAAALRQRRLAAEKHAAQLVQDRHRLARRNDRSNVIGDNPEAMAALKSGLKNADGTTRFAGSARVLTLAQPKPQEDPCYGSLMYGRCMHQHGETVEFPEGRNGQPYTPGIDRDRIVPARPDLSVKPWEGSYSTQLPARQARARAAESNFYVGEPKGYSTSFAASAEGKALRAATFNGLEAEHADRAARLAASRAGNDGNASPQQPSSRWNTHRREGEEEEGDVPPSPTVSVFSHGSSNGPIAATGTQHMVAEPRADREQVSLHLSRYGGAMTASGNHFNLPNRRARECGNAELSDALVKMTLPQLSHRIVETQNIGAHRGQ